MTVLFAEKGSNLRKQQEQAYIHFIDFLDECSGKFFNLFSVYIKTNYLWL